MTITGSIGVTSLMPKFTHFKDKFGVSFHTLTSSKLKSIFDRSRKLNQSDKSVLERDVKFVYNNFLSRVSEGRNIPINKLQQYAQGRIWLGSQAKDYGLIDEIGDLEDAFNEAKTLASLHEQDGVPILKWQPNIKNVSDCLRSLRNMRSCFAPVKKTFVKEFTSSSYTSMLESQKVISVFKVY